MQFYSSLFMVYILCDRFIILYLESWWSFFCSPSRGTRCKATLPTSATNTSKHLYHELLPPNLFPPEIKLSSIFWTHIHDHLGSGDISFDPKHQKLSLPTLFKDGDDTIPPTSSNNGWKARVIHSITANPLMCSNLLDELSGPIVVKVYVAVCRSCDYTLPIGTKTALDSIPCHLVTLKAFVLVYLEGGAAREYCYVVSIGLCNEALLKGVESGTRARICLQIDLRNPIKFISARRERVTSKSRPRTCGLIFTWNQKTL